MLRYFTTGESHGQHMAAILEGLPSGLKMDMDYIDGQLSKRQQGYGRGGRQRIETDRVQLIGGVVKQLSTGAPIGCLLTNKDFKINEMPELFRPRPGHVDLGGALKYAQGIRPVLERSSARETVMRVAVGAICQLFLKEFGIETAAHVVQIGPAKIKSSEGLTVDSVRKKVKGSQVNCTCPKTEKAMITAINAAKRRKDTLGGKYEIIVSGVPIGLGSYVHFERKLDGRIAQILMSKQSVKAVEIGDGTELGERYGSQSHDEILYSKAKGYYRKTNHCGGLEGGVTVGGDIVVKATMKPISTLGKPLRSVNMKTKKTELADFERSDICAVPAGSVIAESLVAYVIADAFIEKFGGDSIKEIHRNYKGYLKQIGG